MDCGPVGNKDNLSSPALGKKSDPNAKLQNRRDADFKWNLTRTSQFIDKSDEVIKDVDELRCLEEFLAKKVSIFLIY